MRVSKYATFVAVTALLVACGGAPTQAAVPAAPSAPRWDELAPPGSRMRVRAPRATRVPHTLTYRADALELAFADATVAPGAERAVVEAYLAHLSARAGAPVEPRPFALGGAEGVEIDVASSPRLRAIVVWRAGAVGRLAIAHAVEDAGLAARVIDSLSFDPERPIDPRAALALDAEPTEELPLLRNTTEQLVFREGGIAAPFAGPRAALDVVWVALPAPPDELAQGRLLGQRFRGLEVEGPAFARLEDGDGLPGIAMHARAEVEGEAVALLGAYLEADGGALLVRGSVLASREAEWAPRLWTLVRSLRVR
ncbi:MAG: hypothetical protein KF729_12890 [Sandaracinaceae bacterium]|nr:hypothetical protein [Sandaracinaceae bacterium]